MLERHRAVAIESPRDWLPGLINEGKQQQADYVRLRWQRDMALGLSVAVLSGCLVAFLWLPGANVPESAAPTPSGPAVTSAAIDLGAESATPREVARTVESWAAAWAAQDVDAYLGFYAAGFQPPGAAARPAWEAERRERLLSPRMIAITLTDLEVELTGSDSATARFTQTYVAPGYGDRVAKILMLTREGDRWRILEERLTLSST